MHLIQAKSLLTRWNGMNLYRGCAHGCAYCDSRSACYHIEHAFEDVAVKANAPELLEDILRRRRTPCMIGTGSMNDPYQPIERDLCLTRHCLELIRDYGFGASVITKSDLVLRDADLLADTNRRTKAVVQITLTIADDELSRMVEPGVCPSSRRFEVLCELRDRHIPTVVWLCPFLPWLTDTDENFFTLLDWCVEAQVRGIVCYGVGLTLREGSREHYYAFLDQHFPGLSDRYRVAYGNAYSVVSENNDRLMARFDEMCERHGIIHMPDECFAYAAAFPELQTRLF